VSTILTKLPQAPLLWWTKRLEPNYQGNLFLVEVDDPINPTSVKHTIFDGCSVEWDTDSVVQVEIEQRNSLAFIHVLSRKQPPGEGWTTGNPVEVHRNESWTFR